MSNFGDDPGGRRTIGAREIALDSWAKNRPAKPSFEYHIDAKFAEPLNKLGGEILPDGRRVIRLSKAKLDLIQSQQTKSETNGAVLLRLISNGKVKF